MKNTGTLKVTLRGDREVVLERVFDAPRALVFEAMTKPELVKKWYGPRGFHLVVCEIDFRVGGKWRYVLRGPDGTDMGQFGEFREITPPERIVMTEGFDMFPDSVAVDTVVFVEEAGKTRLTLTVVAPSKEARDGIIASGMEHGAAETYDRLNELLTSR
jgi:uncharacterized protein YndB with AHSA1/START domain